MSKYRLDKAVERAVARLLGGERVGHLGGADVIAGHLSVEVKSRKALPKWLLDAVAQAVRNSEKGQLPICVLHQAGDLYDDAIVMVRMKDWLEWYGD